MYSNKESVNILTSLLVAYGIRHAVVCPGSRNSPIVHNFHECPDIACYPVTDERSAGFYALGMSLELDEPVVVCVTSGTALLNLAPAVAEAWYQHVPLVVVSADRPPQWIDQLDGQTLPQPDALGRFVGKSVSLPDVSDLESHWYCNRLICEALMEAESRGGHPVHINVPLAEPLFVYDVEALPSEDRIVLRSGTVDAYDVESCGLREDFWQAARPMIVIGQNRESFMTDDQLQALMEHCVVLFEPLGSDQGSSHFDLVLSALGDDESLLPDFVLYGGGTLVSKRLKHFLRKATKADFWEISEDGLLHDTFMRTKGVLEGRLSSVWLSLETIMKEAADFEALFEKSFGDLPDTSDYVSHWRQLLRRAADTTETFEPPYSQMAAVRLLEQKYAEADFPANFHYANSTSVRLACIYSSGYVYCNRGVNGIEGSLSTAAGFSVVAPRKVICVIGDLSFFYDQNALWNQNLRGNLRILLLNNGRGGIFNMLSGLEQSPARDAFVAASHHTSAEGICRQNGVAYLSASSMDELQPAVDTLLNTDSQRPVLLEVFTDAEADARAFRDFYQSFNL